VALAQQLERTWGRRVVPVFLIATEDHDTSEVDHADFWDPATSTLQRVRCPLTPPHDRFAVCSLDERTYRASYNSFTSILSSARGPDKPLEASHPRFLPGVLDSYSDCMQALRFKSAFVEHFESLLDSVFGDLGLLTVRAHELTASAPELLQAGMTHQADLANCLASGSRALRQAGLPASFDAEDPRPLVLESRAGRRRRLAPEDVEAASRLRADPSAFSPHAALRPLIQATALPVIAQVCGPSELLYLGQARGLHALLRATPPVLIPRLEATSVSRRLIDAIGGDLSTLPLPGARPEMREAAAAPAAAVDPAITPPGIDAAAELERRETALLEAARAFAAASRSLEPGNAPAAERWLRRVEHGARRLSETPFWRGRIRQDALSMLRPRGRPQDAVLAWLPDALQHGAPRAWAEHIVSLCRPLDPPSHVLHVPPGAAPDG